MARRRSVCEHTSTAYFEDVTPFWVRPNDPPIDLRYHKAVHELVKWAGPNWVSNDDTFFFPIRHGLIRICEKWHFHDWHSDVRWIRERRENAKHLPQLDRTFTNFSAALRKAPFKDVKRRLGLEFLAELCPDADVRISNKEALAAIDRAIDRFKLSLEVKDRARARYGPIEYLGLPRDLPEREIAIALSLAVFVTVWRRDGLAQGDHIAWQKPVLSKNLPWKAIALFAWSNSANANFQIDTKDVQKRVTSMAKMVVSVDLTQDNSES